MSYITCRLYASASVAPLSSLAKHNHDGTSVLRPTSYVLSLTDSQPIPNVLATRLQLLASRCCPVADQFRARSTSVAEPSRHAGQTYRQPSSSVVTSSPVHNARLPE
jgi:hypothetical protein